MKKKKVVVVVVVVIVGMWGIKFDGRVIVGVWWWEGRGGGVKNQGVKA